METGHPGLMLEAVPKVVALELRGEREPVPIQPHLMEAADALVQIRTQKLVMPKLAQVKE